MASSTKLPGTGSTLALAGHVAFTNPGNITADDTSYVDASVAPEGQAWTEDNFRIVKADGTAGSTNQGLIASVNRTISYTYGSPTDLWGETWTSDDINDADFGAAMSLDLAPGAGSDLGYLRASNFGFTIPDGSTIDGIEVYVDRSLAFGTMHYDYFQITVYYTVLTFKQQTIVY